MSGHRILVIAHAHPDFSLGGGELAAYNLFKAYRERADVEATAFLARVGKQNGATGLIKLRRKGEYLWEQSTANWRMHKAQHLPSLFDNFRELVRTFAPTLVHVHHYAHLGIEFLRVLRRECPDAKILLTIHEYMGICASDGQMVKRGSLELCSRETYDDCTRCFPESTPEDFWLRKRFIQRHFEMADHFVSPSQFLADRYIEWGLPADRISVIENGQEDVASMPPRPLQEGETRNRFGFFGQINKFKGVDVLLEALNTMTLRDRKKLVVEIHGANLEQQEPHFRERIEALRKPLMEQGVVRWVGPYAPSDVRRKMASVDWVVVPSIWWENSPMVIQEAFVAGRPVICSNIGGMAEKVRDGVDGIHFDARSPLSLASALNHGANDNALWSRLVSAIRVPAPHGTCAHRHLQAISIHSGNSTQRAASGGNLA